MKSQSEAEAWEALDVDDSELPSFLRRHKRKSPPPSTSSPNRNSTPNRNPIRPQILRRCSSSQSSENLTPPVLSDSNPLPAETSSYRCSIPGPARFVQAAMLRKAQKDPSSFGEQGDPIPTQEYIRMAVEEPEQEDEDFCRDPWISVVDYIRSSGFMGGDGVSIGTPVSAIKSDFGTWVKVNQVVAVIKTCTPNGLGDLMVTLKDPSGTIDASVHRKVLAESEFGKDIHAGAVLILKKVAVCTLSRLSCYLNITLNNITKVITKDNLSSLKQNNPTKSVNDHDPMAEHEPMQPTTLSLDRGKSERTMNSFGQNVSASDETQTDIEMEDITLAEGSNNQAELRVKQAFTRKQDPKAKTETIGARSIPSRYAQETHKIPERQMQEDAAVKAKTAICQEFLLDEQIGVEKDKAVDSSATEDDKMRSMNSAGSMPQWTDEQLDELFAFD